MSDQFPPPSSGSPEPTVPIFPVDPSAAAPVPPEEPETGGKRSRGGLIALVVGVLVLAGLGGVAFAAYRVLGGGGTRPEDVLPASTLAVVSVDLDPRAGQKVEAIKTFRKFPGLRDTLDLKSGDDLRKVIYRESDGDSCGLKYARDIEPWAGKRAALAAVDLGGTTPDLVIAAQIEDRDAAVAAMPKFADCIEGGYAVGDDYVILAEKSSIARKVLREGRATSLAEDGRYQEWMDKLGDQGVVLGYLAPSLGDYAADNLADLLDELGLGAVGAVLGGGADPFSTIASVPARTQTSPLDDFKKGLRAFQGLAMTVRFADGGLEMAFVADGNKGGDEVPGAPLAELPADTVAAFGFGLSEEGLTRQLKEVRKAVPDEYDQALAEAESTTGLSLPEDAIALLGNGLSLSLSGSAPEGEIAGPQELPVGLALSTDAERAQEIVGTVEDSLGISLSDVGVATASGDGRFALSFSEEYAQALAKKGSLGSTDRFTNAIPDRSVQLGLFVALNKEWREAIASLGGIGLSDSEQQQLEENLDPLESLGISSADNGEVTTFRVRLATS